MIIDATLTEDDHALKERIAWCVSGGYDWVPNGDIWEHVGFKISEFNYDAAKFRKYTSVLACCGHGEVLTSSYTHNYNTICTVTVGEDGNWHWFTEPFNEFER